MAKMPELKDLYEKHRQDGLTVVGVCWDQDVGKARQAIERHGLAWTHVLVPADEKARELWSEAAGIESLPRLLIVDREGVLRADCGPYELKDQVEKVLAQKPANGTGP